MYRLVLVHGLRLPMILGFMGFRLDQKSYGNCTRYPIGPGMPTSLITHLYILFFLVRNDTVTIPCSSSERLGFRRPDNIVHRPTPVASSLPRSISIDRLRAARFPPSLRPLLLVPPARLSLRIELSVGLYPSNASRSRLPSLFPPIHHCRCLCSSPPSSSMSELHLGHANGIIYVAYPGSHQQLHLTLS
jgi:hypothetical protein